MAQQQIHGELQIKDASIPLTKFIDDLVTNPELIAALAAYAPLVGGKVPVANLPPAAIGERFSVANETAMLALTAQIGDIAARQDTGEIFQLIDTDPSALASWYNKTDALIGLGSGVASTQFVEHETPTGVIDGSNRVFTLANTPESGLRIYLNGLLLDPGASNDYTIAGAVVTLTFDVPVTTPPSKIRASYIKP